MIAPPRLIPPRFSAHDTVVRIRPWHPDDIAALLEAVDASRDDLAAWLPWCHAEFGWRDAAGMILSRPDVWRDGLEYSFAVEDAATGELLGDVCLTRVDEPLLRANVGYWIRSDATGRGVATRAVRLLAAFAFRHLGLERLEIVVEVGNEASARVAEKSGARLEGVLARRVRRDGRSRDAHMYALLNPFTGPV